MATIDPRLTTAGLTITVPQLVIVWADHCPANTPVPARCPGCGHLYTAANPLCPSAAVVRPLLRRRRYQVNPIVFEPLTYNQHEDLFGNRLSTAAVPGSLPVIDAPARPTHEVVDLFGGA
jgi:hypothetical protein